jgi:hypothetical protein
MTPRWVEPEGTPEQIADACVAHLAAGGRVDWRTDGARWRPTSAVTEYQFVCRIHDEEHRFALVYSDPPQPERPSETLSDWDDDLVDDRLTAQPARVPAPEGVTVIGWTEPTDDEPRSLPIVDVSQADKIPDGWEWTWGICNIWSSSREHFGYGGSRWYLIRPVPSPPVPETEDDGLRVDIESTIRQYCAQDESDEHTDWVRDLADAIIHVLPLDGTDG